MPRAFGTPLRARARVGKVTRDYAHKRRVGLAFTSASRPPHI